MRIYFTRAMDILILVVGGAEKEAYVHVMSRVGNHGDLEDWNVSNVGEVIYPVFGRVGRA